MIKSKTNFYEMVLKNVHCFIASFPTHENAKYNVDKTIDLSRLRN